MQRPVVEDARRDGDRRVPRPVKRVVRAVNPHGSLRNKTELGGLRGECAKHEVSAPHLRPVVVGEGPAGGEKARRRGGGLCRLLRLFIFHRPVLKRFCWV